MNNLLKLFCALMLSATFSLAVVAGCTVGDDDDDDNDDVTADDDDDNGDTTSFLDPDVEPVTEGSWFKPDTGTTWQWQLIGEINDEYEVDVYDIDLFDNDADTISALQEAGFIVICYFSAGSSEDWRDDFDQFDDADMGSDLDEWEGERWLDIRSENVWDVMLNRLDLAVDKGCDGVEPDNVDGFINDTGFDLNADDQLAFNRNLANEAHDRGLTVGLKNDGDQAEDLVDYYDFSLNEQCHEYGECDQLQPFLDADKPVFNAEYAESESEAADLADSVCPDALDEDIRTLIMPWDLDDAFRVSCDE